MTARALPGDRARVACDREGCAQSLIVAVGRTFARDRAAHQGWTNAKRGGGLVLDYCPLHAQAGGR
jgi:hypothetical protein